MFHYSFSQKWSFWNFSVVPLWLRKSSEKVLIHPRLHFKEERCPKSFAFTWFYNIFQFDSEKVLVSSGLMWIGHVTSVSRRVTYQCVKSVPLAPKLLQGWGFSSFYDHNIYILSISTGKENVPWTGSDGSFFCYQHSFCSFRRGWVRSVCACELFISHRRFAFIFTYKGC